MLQRNAVQEKGIWQLQEAKAMFSELVKAAAGKPQTVTKRGKETAVVLSIAEYQRLTHPSKTLFELLQASPLRGVELELPPREAEPMREIDW
jgi:prevent-host-death family protein